MYDVDWIETVDECDALITEAEEEKSLLDTRIVNLQQRQKTLTGTSAEVAAEFTSNKTQLDAVNAVMAAIPEGKAKIENEKIQKRLDYKQFLLGNRKKSYGVVAKLEVQHDLKCSSLVRDEKVEYINALQGRRNILAA